MRDLQKIAKKPKPKPTDPSAGGRDIIDIGGF